MLAPTGFTRIADPQGELAVARAAARAELPYTLSTLATRSIEEVAGVSDGRTWFQVYAWRDRGLVKDMVERCRASGYEALVMTVDTAVLGRRERDVRRGFELPPKLGLGTLLDGAVHPGWTWAFARAEPIVFANVATAGVGGGGPGDGSDAVTLATYVNAQFDPNLSWDDVDWLRSVWDGPIVLKGIQCVADAVLAAERGVDAIALSNHGGRQLDSAPAPIELVGAGGRCGRRPHRGHLRRWRAPRQRHRQGRRARRTACMAGRAYLYGLGAAGERGVDHVLSMLHTDVRRTMALLGAPTIGDLHRDLVAVPAERARAQPVTAVICCV